MECRNCSTSLNSEQRFCFECGAKVIKNRLTIKNLSEDFSEQFLSYDNKFLITFFDLFRKPEAVIYGYIKGTRKKYINVIQYLAISLTLLGIQLFILNKFLPDFFGAQLTDLDKMLEAYPEKSRALTKKFLTDYFTFINEYQSLVYVLGIPFNAAVTYLVFLREKLLNYTEHIVLNTYVTAQYVVFSFFATLIFAVFNLDINILVTISLLLYMFYYGFIFYKIYRLSYATIILRFMLSMVIICAFFFLVFVLGTLVAIIYLKYLK